MPDAGPASLTVAVLLVLGLGGAAGWLARRAGLPAPVGQVLLGVVLGEAALGWVVPHPAVHWLGQVGVVLLLGMAGLELGLDNLKSAGWPAFWVAVLGIVLSAASGFAVGVTMGSVTVEAVYIGLALTATSIGISVQTLEQFGLITHRVGRIVVAAAVIDDILALLLLAAAHGVFGTSGEPLRSSAVAALALPVLGAIFWGVRQLTRLYVARAAPAGASSTVAGILVILAAGGLTGLLGYSAVVGAFFAALGISVALDEASRAVLIGRLSPLVLVLAPFFFVLIGAEAQLTVLVEPRMGALLAALLVAALGGKFLGGLVGASGSPLPIRMLVGLSMIPRGEVTIVIAGIALAQQHLSHHVFVVIVSVAIVAAILGPLLMTPLVRRMASGE